MKIEVILIQQEEIDFIFEMKYDCTTFEAWMIENSKLQKIVEMLEIVCEACAPIHYVKFL